MNFPLTQTDWKGAYRGSLGLQSLPKAEMQSVNLVFSSSKFPGKRPSFFTIPDKLSLGVTVSGTESVQAAITETP